jgi:dTDP-4-dehydrorhamnose reductase
VGSELACLFESDAATVALDRTKADFTKPISIIEALEFYKPQIIINASAYTNVDAAEKPEEFDKVIQINALTPKEIANWSKKNAAWLIHYSTDYVYDGTKTEKYLETDAANPINVYGRSKAEGDWLIKETGCSHIILRTSWVYSTIGKNFLLTILRLAREKEELKIVSDQIGSPSYAKCLSQATKSIVEKLVADGMKAQSGVYHFVSPDQTSWYEFAKSILDLDPQKNSQICKTVTPVSSAEFGSKTKRPLNSALDVSKLEKTFGIKLPSWKVQLEMAIRDLS